MTVLFGFGVWLVGPVHGQVNAESLASAARAEGFGWDAGVRGAVLAGNLQLTDLSGSTSLHWRRTFASRNPDQPAWLRDRALATARGAYRNLRGSVILDQRLLHVRYLHMFGRRAGIDGFAQLNNDVVRLLRSRIVVGLGSSVAVVNRRRLEGWVGLAAMAEWEVRSVPADGPDAPRVFNPRASAYASWTVGLVPERLSWIQTVYVQPRVDAPGDLQWLLDGTLRVAISKRLSQATGLQVRGDTRPPADLRHIDLLWTFGFDLHVAAARPVPAPP